jgi:hypothetical protein
MGIRDQCLMRWEPKRQRWYVTYKGKRYWFNGNGNKESTYQKANEWWRSKRAEIAGQTPPHHYQYAIDDLTERNRWNALNAPHAVRGFERLIELVKATPNTPDDAENVLRIVDPEPCVINGERVDIPAVVWDDRISGMSAPVQVDKTVGSQVDAYLARQTARVVDRQISSGEFDNVRRCLHTFRDWLGHGNSIDAIDASKLTGYHAHLRAMPLSVDYKKQHLRIAKAFVKSLAQHELIPAPLNLQSREHRFGGSSRPETSVM